jgi:hypothetical protein
MPFSAQVTAATAATVADGKILTHFFARGSVRKLTVGIALDMIAGLNS